ncbi:MAG TPA: hypothetical protein VGB63_10475 [Pedobacter sp.]
MSDFIRNNHLGDIKTLLRIYNAKGALYNGTYLWISLVVTLVLTLICYYSAADFYKLIQALCNIYTSVLPSLLGFNLGAYALLIGLGSSSFIGRFSRKFAVKITLFQRASSVFGFCVLLQALALIAAFFYNLIIIIQEQSQLSLMNNFFDDIDAVNKFNAFAFYFLNFIGTYSVLIIIKVVENIFSLSQLAHFYSGLDQRDETNKKRDNFDSLLINNIKYRRFRR